MKLTQRKIEALVCPEGRKDALYFDDDRRGLAVRVAASAKTGSLEAKNFLAQFTVDGQKRRVPLGACSAISLDAARKATAAMLGEVAHGRDPAAARKEAAREAKRKADHEALTLSALIEQWERIRLAEKRESYASEAVRALRFAFDGHLKRPAADLSRHIVVRLLDELTKKGKAAMAARTAAYGRACYGWAIRRGSLAENPFAALPLAPVAKRDRILSDEELRSIWQATEAPGVFNAIVRTLILTGQRREEVTGMAWVEFDNGLTTWSLPAARAKNGIAHIVPLSAQARANIEARGLRSAADEANPASAFVFPGRGGPFNGFGKAKAALDEASRVKDWRLHDLRRTVATGLQKLGVRLEVTESVLNHVSGSRAGIVGIYQRHDYAAEKRAALDAWGAHVEAIVENWRPVSNVTFLSHGCDR
jgi:integrase